MKRIMALMPVLAVLSACASNPPDMETAKRAAAEGDYQTSLHHYQQLADFGIPEANVEMGKHYYKGQGVKKDMRQALVYFDKAETSNNPRIANYMVKAKTEMGVAALKDGGRDSAVVGLDYLKEAAQAGDKRALFELGYAYENGTGVPRDGKKALSYYSQASALGYGRADFQQARLYEKGELVPQNYSLAIDYYEAAVQKGYPRAYLNMGRLYEKGLGVNPDRQKALAYYNYAEKMGIPADKDLNRLQKTVGQS